MSQSYEQRKSDFVNDKSHKVTVFIVKSIIFIVMLCVLVSIGVAIKAHAATVLFIMIAMVFNWLYELIKKHIT